MSTARLWSAAFVFLWSTGFIGARYGLPYAEPMTLLGVRFAIAALLLWLVSRVAFRGAKAAAWPPRADVPAIVLVGVLVHGVYLGGVFVAMSWGLEAGAAAVITSLAPIFTAILAATTLGERFSAMRVIGVALGFGGVALVVSSKLQEGVGSLTAAMLCVCSALAFALGAVIQKRRLSEAPLISANGIQYAAAALFAAPFALLFETRVIDWTPTFVLALGWLVCVLSLGAVFLLYLLLRRGEAASVSSLMFLVPSSTALIAWLAFGETLSGLAVLGVGVSALGVALVNNTAILSRRRAPL